SERGVRLADLTATELKAAHPAIDADVTNVLGVRNALHAFKSFGSTAPEQVAKQVAAWKQKLGTMTDDR
ncbi:MAG TPA: hypothetical protein VHV77_02795, partial [Pirellulales bacterium]|nr:hypothetical protein [Pirellulales bacterium]